MKHKSFQKFTVSGVFKFSLSGEVKSMTDEEINKALKSAVLEVESRLNGAKMNGFNVALEMSPEFKVQSFAEKAQVLARLRG